jgi:hypothetical protein
MLRIPRTAAAVFQLEDFLLGVSTSSRRTSRRSSSRATALTGMIVGPALRTSTTILARANNIIVSFKPKVISPGRVLLGSTFDRVRFHIGERFDQLIVRGLQRGALEHVNREQLVHGFTMMPY